MKKIVLKTSDGIELVGIYRNNGHKKVAILLHMMPATKESWETFAIELDRAGYASIAIDERGHGESTMGGTLDYRTFDETQQQEKIHDVEAAHTFLAEQGFLDAQMVLIGASIGANLSIQFLTDHPQIQRAVALSPGLNYRGVKTDGFIRQLHEGQRVILVASDDDDRDSAQSCRELHRLNQIQTVLIEKKNLGHGTTMFEKEPGLMGEVIERLSE